MRKVIDVKNLKSLDDMLLQLSKDDIDAFKHNFENFSSSYSGALIASMIGRRHHKDYTKDSLVEYVKSYILTKRVKLDVILQLVEIVLILGHFLKEEVSFDVTIGSKDFSIDSFSDLNKLFKYAEEMGVGVNYVLSDMAFGNIDKKITQDVAISTGFSISLFKRTDLYNLPQFPNDSFKKIYKLLKEGSDQRTLVRIEKQNMLSNFKKLREDFPNFKEVIDYIEDDILLYGSGDLKEIIKFEPILLGGEPGIGKTEFSSKLSEILNIPYVSSDMSSVSSPRILSGADSTWSNSKPGLIFNQLCEGSVANPLIFLDEIDKVSNNSQEGYPLTALYSLLETSSNNAFKDEFFPLPINAQYINIVAAVNDPSKIPDPLFSRFNYFDIPKPTGVQLRSIAKSIVNNILTKVLPSGHGFSAVLSNDILDYIENQEITPRSMSRMFKNGFKKALKDGRIELQLSDIEDVGITKTSGFNM